MWRGMLTVAVMALGLAVPAQAATVTRTAVSVTVTSDVTSDIVRVVHENGSFVVEAEKGLTTVDCTPVEPTRVECEPSAAVVFDAGGGNDTVTFEVPAPATMHGGEGTDTVRFVGSTAVTFHGGAGTDSADFTAATGPATVTLDDSADDGVGASTTGNVRSDVEKVVGSAYGDSLTGNAAANVLEGAAGNDVVEGGAGADALSGGDGADTMRAADATPDSVDCGADADTPLVDDVDTLVGCESPTISPTDRDGDGALGAADCAEGDATRHPGAADIPGNGIDEDCSGADTPVPPATTGPPATVGTAARLQWQWRTRRGRSRLVTARVDRLPAGGTVTIRCTGKGCPFKTLTLASKGRPVDIAKLFRGRRLRPGARLTVTVAEPGKRSRVVTWRCRSGARKPIRL